MRKAIFYGLILALLIFALKTIEYKFLVRELPIEIYIGIIAVMFSVLGIWAGLKLTRPKRVIVRVAQSPFVLSEDNLKSTGISRRELDVLELMAEGLSNQEIADRLFLSLNTVKTHTSGLFIKLDVKRRTQAVQKGKELRLIP
ncbi:MAG TPA: response regulator transcription factor [Chryseosolibacter sp.]